MLIQFDVFDAKKLKKCSLLLMLVAFSVVASFLLFVVVVVILLKEFLKSDVKVYALFMHQINVSFFFFSCFFLSSFLRAG